MVNKIITLDDLVERDKKGSVQEWMLWMCAQAIAAEKIERGWDGSSVEGEPVLAFVNNGRWLARCKVCSNPVYVSWKTPIFYCTECGNGGSTSAWGVEFPVEREAIEAALLARPVELGDRKRLIRNEVELALNSRPVIAGLARNWRSGIALATLEAENAMAFAKQGARR